MHTQKDSKEKTCVVHVTTYPPRECGLATFSADLISYGDELFGNVVENKVVAINTEQTGKHKYSPNVIIEIGENNKEEYESAALQLNGMSEVKIVSIQHEFGIFGLNYGENIIFFLEKLEKPAVVTFHTVLPNPPEGLKYIVKKILDRAERFVVMTELSKDLLVRVYDANPDQIKVIPHGIHPQLYVNTNDAKKKLGLDGKLVLSTFGLLGPGKGIEYAIEALPEIIKKHPNVAYLVLGQTHPVVLRNEGETYRNSLIKKAKQLGVEKNIIFQNKYLNKEDLLLFLEATDIYLALSQNPDQAVSGTLSYALGAGRAVISTSFMQAKEIVTGDVGVLVPFSNHQSIETEVLKLLGNSERLQDMGKTAYFSTRKMTWPNVSLSYMNLFSSMLPGVTERKIYLLPIKIDHLKKLTDDFGIFQFAALHYPDPRWGYTLDDNARALALLCLLNNQNPSKETERLINTYFSFIERAATESGFVNYFDAKENPEEELNKNVNLEDTTARALWALSVLGSSKTSSYLKMRARNLFEKQFNLHKNITSPRAAALYIKAIAQYNSKKNENESPLNIKQYADFLVDLFEKSSDENWQWFEEGLTYSNALLPEALLVAYSITEDQKYFEVAKKSLDFLLENSFEGDVCVPVGQAGWFKKGGSKERYDQQPEEVSAMVFALHRIISISDEGEYQRKMLLCFEWFFGNNLSRQVVYTHSTGGCYDGITRGGTNLNQGAESSISYLLARVVMENFEA